MLPDGRHQDLESKCGGESVLRPAGRTLTVWFGNPHLEETADEVVLMKDGEGKVIGFERLNFTVPEPERLHVTSLASLADVLQIQGHWIRHFLQQCEGSVCWFPCAVGVHIGYP